MRMLSNDTLVDTYFKAIDLKLEPDFIRILQAEINRRKINLIYYRSEAN